jgi:D-aminopeptidase
MLSPPAFTPNIAAQPHTQVLNVSSIKQSPAICSHPTLALLPTPYREAANPSTTLPPIVRRLINPQGMGISSSPPRLIPPQWRHFESGPLNAITDVPSLKVGHMSVQSSYPHRLNTGVTAIVPDAANLLPGGNLATTGFRASAVTLNGNGELTGMGPLLTAGVLNSPIVLTSTSAVGVAHTGVSHYMNLRFPGEWSGQLPVIGECWDGFFSDPRQQSPLLPSDTMAAISAAKGGVLPQGRTGAGTGMRSFELHAGIGSASRQVVFNNQVYTIGVLVNSNHSKLAALNPELRAVLEQTWSKPLESIRDADNRDQAISSGLISPHTPTRQGSIMVIIATDLPLDAQALHQVAERAALGIANTGSFMATTSGDFALAFSTANPLLLGEAAPKIVASQTVHPDALSPVLQATVEAVTEAQLNAIVAAHSQ